MNLEDPTVVCFLTASSTAYKNCAVYTKNKFPLLNSTLKAFAALGPCYDSQQERLGDEVPD